MYSGRQRRRAQKNIIPLKAPARWQVTLIPLNLTVDTIIITLGLTYEEISGIIFAEQKTNSSQEQQQPHNKIQKENDGCTVITRKIPADDETLVYRIRDGLPRARCCYSQDDPGFANRFSFFQFGRRSSRKSRNVCRFYNTRLDAAVFCVI